MNGLGDKMEFVSAGDIEKYAYCPLSWWLSKEHKSVHKNGVKKHLESGKELEDIKRKEEKVRLYERFVLLISVAATVAALIGLSFLYGKMEKTWNIFFIMLSFLWLYNSLFFLYKAGKSSILKPRYEKIILLSSVGAIMIATFSIVFSLPPSPEIGRFTEILAFLWVVSANLIFYRTLNISEEIVEKKIKYAPLEGEIEYIGNSREGKEMESQKYGLRGKPDYVIKIGDDYIPVEEKSMESNHPRFSHVMQITAYCMIIEDVYGKAPPYGIIKYADRQFKIPYEERWKNMVINIRKNMLKDREKGRAHRNHNNPKKCAGCSRREYCPERLA